jgi:hypothetical protein
MGHRIHATRGTKHIRYSPPILTQSPAQAGQLENQMQLILQAVLAITMAVTTYLMFVVLLSI